MAYGTDVAGSIAEGDWRWCDDVGCTTGAAFSSTVGDAFTGVGALGQGLDIHHVGPKHKCARYKRDLDYLENESCDKKLPFVCELYSGELQLQMNE